MKCGTSKYCADTTETNIFPKLLEFSAPLAEVGLSRLARKHSMAVIDCYNKRLAGSNYNVAAVFDRKGDIVGEYHKTHLPPNEKWQLTEGDSLGICP